MKVYTLTNEDLSQNVNLGIQCLVEVLKRDKIITEIQAKDILEQYAVIVTPARTYGKTISSLMGVESNDPIFRAVKVF